MGLCRKTEDEAFFPLLLVWEAVVPILFLPRLVASSMCAASTYVVVWPISVDIHQYRYPLF